MDSQFSKPAELTSALIFQEWSHPLHVYREIPGTFKDHRLFNQKWNCLTLSTLVSLCWVQSKDRFLSTPHEERPSQWGKVLLGPAEWNLGPALNTGFSELRIHLSDGLSAFLQQLHLLVVGRLAQCPITISVRRSLAGPR